MLAAAPAPDGSQGWRNCPPSPFCRAGAEIANSTFHGTHTGYDALDRRIARTVDADGEGAGGEVTKHFVYDRDDVLLDFIDADGSNAADQPEFAARYLFGPGVDQVLAQEVASTGETHWLLTDHLGTVKEIVDNVGTVLNHIVYDSFGGVFSHSDPLVTTRYLFTGREFDTETELYYYRARYFDAEIGRFINEDPIGFAGNDTNLFRYVGNSPISATDPSGKVIPAVIGKVLIDVAIGVAIEAAGQFIEGKRDDDALIAAAGEAVKGSIISGDATGVIKAIAKARRFTKTVDEINQAPVNKIGGILDVSDEVENKIREFDHLVDKLNRTRANVDTLVDAFKRLTKGLKNAIQNEFNC